MYGHMNVKFLRNFNATLKKFMFPSFFLSVFLFSAYDGSLAVRRCIR